MGIARRGYKTVTGNVENILPGAPPSGSTRRGVEGVAGGADGADEVGVLVAVQRDAQAADMDVDGAGLDIDVLAPHRVQKLLAREDAAGMLHEMAQQAGLGGPRVD